MEPWYQGSNLTIAIPGTYTRPPGRGQSLSHRNPPNTQNIRSRDFTKQTDLFRSDSCLVRTDSYSKRVLHTRRCRLCLCQAFSAAGQHLYSIDCKDDKIKESSVLDTTLGSRQNDDGSFHIYNILYIIYRISHNICANTRELIERTKLTS